MTRSFSCGFGRVKIPGRTEDDPKGSGLGAFFFSALLPESAKNGDVLRLQVLEHVHVQPDDLKLASDWGEQLLALCIADRERVAAHLRALRLSD